jgi:hypothetical protein
MRQYFNDLGGQEAKSSAISEFRDLGDRVLGLGRHSLRSASGVEFPDQEIACIWKWRDGRCVEARTYLSHAEALEGRRA